GDVPLPGDAVVSRRAVRSLAPRAGSRDQLSGIAPRGGPPRIRIQRGGGPGTSARARRRVLRDPDRKSTRLNSSHQIISYAVFCFYFPLHLSSFPTRRSSDLGDVPLPGDAVVSRRAVRSLAPRAGSRDQLSGIAPRGGPPRIRIQRGGGPGTSARARRRVLRD